MSGLLALALSGGVALGGVARFAVVVGANEGALDTRPLVFAETDARKVHGLLTDLGGVPPEQARLVVGSGRNAVLHALADVRDAVAMAEARGDETVVIFYYSGHADAERLQLGRTWLTYAELEDLLGRSGADVRVALLDACQSGAMTGAGRTRDKGGTRAPSFVFDLQERLDAQGQVVITSSADDEASQESDEIGGSYFTHFLASALSGAADDDADSKVTLSEAYRYVYRETVFRTSSARTTQHPTFSWELAGRGDVVLADLSEAKAPLIFPAGMVGRYAVFDESRRGFVAEVELDGTESVEVHLTPGSYLVQQRYPTHLEVAEVTLDGQQPVTLGGTAFASQEYEDDVAKGAIDQVIKRSRRPQTSLHLGLGSRSFTSTAIQDAYFPTVGGLSLAGRWTWRAGPWVSADLFSAGAQGELLLPDLDYGIPVSVRTSAVGVASGVSTGPRLVRAGAGVRLASTYLRRSFPGQEVAAQDLFTVAPGLVGFVSLNPGPYVVELELRGHYLPYRLDGADLGLGFTEAVLSFGYRL